MGKIWKGDITDCPQYHPIINTGGLRETTTIPRQAYRCFARDANQVLPKLKSSVLPLKLPTLVLCSWKVSLNNSRKICLSFTWNSFIYLGADKSLARSTSRCTRILFNGENISFGASLVIYMIYLLTAIGLSPGGSSTVHIYTQTIHRPTQLIWESAGRAPSLRVIPWHLPYNWRKSRGKPQSG